MGFHSVKTKAPVASQQPGEHHLHQNHDPLLGQVMAKSSRAQNVLNGKSKVEVDWDICTSRSNKQHALVLHYPATRTCLKGPVSFQWLPARQSILSKSLQMVCSRFQAERFRS